MIRRIFIVPRGVRRVRGGGQGQGCFGVFVGGRTTTTTTMMMIRPLCYGNPRRPPERSLDPAGTGTFVLSTDVWRRPRRPCPRHQMFTTATTTTTTTTTGDGEDKDNPDDESTSTTSTFSTDTILLESKINSAVANIQQLLLTKSTPIRSTAFHDDDNDNNNNRDDKLPTTHSTKQHDEEKLVILKEKAEALLDILENDVTPEMRQYMETNARSQKTIMHGAVWIMASQSLNIFQQMAAELKKNDRASTMRDVDAFDTSRGAGEQRKILWNTLLRLLERAHTLDMPLHVQFYQNLLSVLPSIQRVVAKDNNISQTAVVLASQVAETHGENALGSMLRTVILDAWIPHDRLYVTKREDDDDDDNNDNTSDTVGLTLTADVMAWWLESEHVTTTAWDSDWTDDVLLAIRDVLLPRACWDAIPGAAQGARISTMLENVLEEQFETTPTWDSSSNTGEDESDSDWDDEDDEKEEEEEEEDDNDDDDDDEDDDDILLRHLARYAAIEQVLKEEAEEDQTREKVAVVEDEVFDQCILAKRPVMQTRMAALNDKISAAIARFAALTHRRCVKLEPLLEESIRGKEDFAKDYLTQLSAYHNSKDDRGGDSNSDGPRVHPLLCRVRSVLLDGFQNEITKKYVATLMLTRKIRLLPFDDEDDEYENDVDENDIQVLPADLVVQMRETMSMYGEIMFGDAQHDRRMWGIYQSSAYQQFPDITEQCKTWEGQGFLFRYSPRLEKVLYRRLFANEFNTRRTESPEE
eukprot:scaffold8601_cov191-Amphora_coffeaeformis.AAC.11